MRWLAGFVLGGAVGSAVAFQVLPRISDVDRELAARSDNQFQDRLGQWIVSSVVPRIKSPVHEAITLKALGCAAANGREEDCVVQATVLQHQVLLYGVRWPDDPPFRLSRKLPPRSNDCDPRVTLRSTAQPQCWKMLFDDAAKKASVKLKNNPLAPAFGPGDYLLYRSHFGDLQFMHGMAAHDGEEAMYTQRRMKMWARFLWGIASGELAKEKFIRDLDVGDLGSYFPGDMTAVNLLAAGVVEVRQQLGDVALGALLHMVQDSFSQAHTARQTESDAKCKDASQYAEPGRIEQFYSYAGQVDKLHDHEDTFDALGLQTLQTDPNVVDATRAVLDLHARKVRWKDASAYFDCLFVVVDPNAKADAGPYANR